jgi:hypothetical protein
LGKPGTGKATALPGIFRAKKAHSKPGIDAISDALSVRTRRHDATEFSNE